MLCEQRRWRERRSRTFSTNSASSVTYFIHKLHECLLVEFPRVNHNAFFKITFRMTFIHQEIAKQTWLSHVAVERFISYNRSFFSSLSARFLIYFVQELALLPICFSSIEFSAEATNACLLFLLPVKNIHRLSREIWPVSSVWYLGQMG